MPNKFIWQLLFDFINYPLPTECYKWGTNQKKFLLTPLFCTSILKMVAMVWTLWVLSSSCCCCFCFCCCLKKHKQLNVMLDTTYYLSPECHYRLQLLLVFHCCLLLRILSHVVHIVQVKVALKLRLKLTVIMMSLSIHIMTSQGRMCVQCVRNGLQRNVIWMNTEKDTLEESRIHALSVRNVLQLRMA